MLMPADALSSAGRSTLKPSAIEHLRSPADASRTALARTQAHERFHLDELRNGLPFPWAEESRKAYEARAYAYEERWWQEHKHLLEGE